MHMSFKSGNKALIHFLFENGADLNVVNDDNMTPICFGSYRLLNEMNLLEGFAVLNQEVATREMEKRANRAQSILALKKHSTLLDQKIRDMIAKSSVQPDPQVPVEIISDDESEAPIRVPENPPRPPQLTGAKSLLGGKKSGFFKCLKKRMSVQKQSSMFRSNDANRRLKKGKSIQVKSSSKGLRQKSHNADRTQKNKPQKSKRVLTLREIKFNRLMKEKRQRERIRSNLEFTNNFLVDTCGSDVFLLKKLPQLYDPNRENEIVHKFRSLGRDLLTKNPTIRSINRSLRWQPA